jgi:hypothetical protein
MIDPNNINYSELNVKQIYMNFMNSDSPLFNGVKQEYPANMNEYIKQNYNVNTNVDLSIVNNGLPDLYKKALKLIEDLKSNTYTPTEVENAYNSLKCVITAINNNQLNEKCNIKESFENIEGFNNPFNDSPTSTFPNNPTPQPYIKRKNNDEYQQGLPNDALGVLKKGGMIKIIENEKIAPLQNEIATYTTLVNNINQNYTNILSKIYLC